MTTSEGKLLKLSKFAMISAQIAGYLPASISYNPSLGRYLQFNPVHLCPFYSLTFFILILIWLIIFLYNFSSILKLQSYLLGGFLFGLTQNLSQLFSGLTILFLKAFGFLQISSVLQFWHKTVTFVEQHQVLSNGYWVIKLESQEFQRILWDTKTRFLGYCLLICVQLATFDFREVLTTIITKWSYLPWLHLVGIILSLFQIFATFTHHGHPIWIIFFIKLYKNSLRGLLKFIDDRIILDQELNGNFAFNKSLIKRDSNKKSKITNALGDIKYPLVGTVGIGIIGNIKTDHSQLDIIEVPKGLKNVDIEVNEAIDFYKGIEEEIERFNRVFNWRLTIEYAYQVLFLGINLVSLIWVLWTGKGGFMRICEPIIPGFLAISALWCISSEGDELMEAGMQILKRLENVPLETLRWETQLKLQMLVSRASPCRIKTNFFFIDIRILTPISGWIVMSLIILLV